MTPDEPAEPMTEQAEEAQTEFLTAAIEDTQDVIRVIDTKVGALFFGLSIPLSKLEAIWLISKQVLEGAAGIGSGVVWALLGIFTVTWGISLLVSLRAIFHVDNPAEHIVGDKPPGTFYNAGLFRVSWWDTFFPRRLRSRVNFAAFCANLPQSREAVRKELSFELMKLVYIRTIKMKRTRLAFYSFYAWLVSGFLIWMVQLAGNGNAKVPIAE